MIGDRRQLDNRSFLIDDDRQPRSRNGFFQLRTRHAIDLSDAMASAKRGGNLHANPLSADTDSAFEDHNGLRLRHPIAQTAVTRRGWQTDW